MTSVLESKLGAMAEVCMRHGAVRLYAFGSALRDDFRPGESDLLTMAMDSEPQGLLAKAMVAMIGGVLQQAIEGDLDMVKAYCERTSA